MTIPKMILIHGAYGHPEENWFGWLKRELACKGITCVVPAFPTPEGQTLRNWKNIFREQGGPIDSNTILIGHSLGAALVLRWLESEPMQVKATILVGAFVGSVGIERFDSINRDFFENPFQWQRIQKASTQWLSYYGTEDPYVSKAHFDWLAKQLKAQKIVISKGGHFNQAAGFCAFPHLLQHLMEKIEW